MAGLQYFSGIDGFSLGPLYQIPQHVAQGYQLAANNLSQ
jgi:hypothetical protein